MLVVHREGTGDPVNYAGRCGSLFHLNQAFMFPASSILVENLQLKNYH